MWLDNIKELKKSKGMSTKQIADATKLPERTVNRIFSGDTDNPYVDTLHRIVSVLGGSLDDILADTKVVVATESLVEVKETAIVAEAERDMAAAENEALKAENEALKAELAALKGEAEEAAEEARLAAEALKAEKERKEQEKIRRHCREVGGEYEAALLEFVTREKGYTAICLKHNLSCSTLYRIVKKFYEGFPR